MVSIESKARPSEYDASLLTSGSVLAAASLLLLLFAYILYLCTVRRVKLMSVLN
jgi:hypothetical protein